MKGDLILSRFSKKALWYQWIVGILGVGTALFYLSSILHHHFIIILSLAIMAALLEAFPVTVQQVNTTLTVAVLLAAMIVYGVGAVVWVIAIGSLLSKLVKRRKTSLSIEMFNVGQYALSAWIMAVLFHLFYFESVISFDWRLFWAMGAASLMYVAANNAFIHAMRIAWGDFKPNEAIRFTAIDGLNSIIALPFAFLMIFISPIHPLLAPAATLPIILLARSMGVHQRTKELQVVFRVASNLTSEFDRERIIAEVSRVAHRLSGADTVVVFLLDKSKNHIVPLAVLPPHVVDDFSSLINLNLEEDGGVIWQAIHERREIYVPDTSKDRRVVRDGNRSREHYQSIAVYPMYVHNEVQGAIVCYGKRAYAFSYIRDYMTTLANQASVLLENAKLYQELQERSLYDGATGLYNYRYFYEALEHCVTTSLEKKSPVSVAIIDIDFFKKFNDTYGHLAGDEVLRSIAKLLLENSGPETIVARYGGEEFALILPMNANQALETIERIRNIASNHVVDFQGYKLQGITFSSGIASCPEHTTDDRDLILKADSTMYWGAKQRGRNRTSLYTPEYEVQLFVDELTGLYTFHFVDIRIREEMLQGTVSWGIIGINLARFSLVNENFGFEVGDSVLRQTGIIIKESLRQSELACRYGGDEVLVLLPNVNPNELHAVAERLSRSITSYRFALNTNIVISLKVHILANAYPNVSNPGELFECIGKLFASLKHDNREVSARSIPLAKY